MNLNLNLNLVFSKSMNLNLNLNLKIKKKMNGSNPGRKRIKEQPRVLCHAPVTNIQKSPQRILAALFLCAVFLTIYFCNGLLCASFLTIYFATVYFVRNFFRLFILTLTIFFCIFYKNDYLINYSKKRCTNSGTQTALHSYSYSENAI